MLTKLFELFFENIGLVAVLAGLYWLFFAKGIETVKTWLSSVPKTLGVALGLGLVALLIFVGFMSVSSDESRAQLDKMTAPVTSRTNRDAEIYLFETGFGVDPINDPAIKNPILVAHATERLLDQQVQNESLKTELALETLKRQCAGTIDPAGNVIQDQGACDKLNTLQAQQLEDATKNWSGIGQTAGDVVSDFAEPILEKLGEPIGDVSDPATAPEWNWIPVWAVVLGFIALVAWGRKE